MFLLLFTFGRFRRLQPTGLTVVLRRRRHQRRGQGTHVVAVHVAAPAATVAIIGAPPLRRRVPCHRRALDRVDRAWVEACEVGRGLRRVR